MFEITVRLDPESREQLNRIEEDVREILRILQQSKDIASFAVKFSQPINQGDK
jgi:hypothetical protein